MLSTNFNLTAANLFFGYHQLAARTAVLFPLAPGAKQAISDIYAKVLERWRARVCNLAGLGWTLVNDPDTPQGPQLNKFFSCPPVGVHTEKLMRSCERSRICPWCYSRQVVFPIYYSVNWLLFRLLQPDELSRVKLFAFTRTPSKQYASAAELSGSMRIIRKKLDEMYGRFGKAALGGYLAVTFSPAAGPNAKPHEVELAYRGFVLLPEGKKAPDWPEAKITQIAGAGLPEQPTREGLAKTVGTILQYPVSMMSGDAETTLMVLEASRLTKGQTRNIQAYGVMDNEILQQFTQKLHGGGEPELISGNNNKGAK